MRRYLYCKMKSVSQHLRRYKEMIVHNSEVSQLKNKKGIPYTKLFFKTELKSTPTDQKTIYIFCECLNQIVTTLHQSLRKDGSQTTDGSVKFSLTDRTISSISSPNSINLINCNLKTFFFKLFFTNSTNFLNYQS